MNDLQVKIRNLTEKKLWLAPLAGYTDQYFRQIARKCGADVLVSEMVSADGLVYNYDKTSEYALFQEHERPYGVQLFSDKPEMMKRATELILPLAPDFIDINMGCPVKKVVNRNSGSALMKDIQLAEKIVQSVKSVCELAGLPLSVKFRSGWDFDSINVTEFAQAMENAGADILIVHPRTRSQMFSGHSDWKWIAEVKNRVKIPVVGNGDIVSVESAEQMLEMTGCDSLMIGRGALGKPWIFNEIKNHYQESPISEREKLQIILEHLQLLVASDQNHKLFTEMRAHIAYYTKGIKNGSHARDIIFHSQDISEIINTLKGLFNDFSG